MSRWVSFVGDAEVGVAVSTDATLSYTVTTDGQSVLIAEMAGADGISNCAISDTSAIEWIPVGTTTALQGPKIYMQLNPLVGTRDYTFQADGWTDEGRGYVYVSQYSGVKQTTDAAADWVDTDGGSTDVYITTQMPNTDYYIISGYGIRTRVVEEDTIQWFSDDATWVTTNAETWQETIGGSTNRMIEAATYYGAFASSDAQQIHVGESTSPASKVVWSFMLRPTGIEQLASGTLSLAGIFQRTFFLTRPFGGTLSLSGAFSLIKYWKATIMGTIRMWLTPQADPIEIDVAPKGFADIGEDI